MLDRAEGVARLLCVSPYTVKRWARMGLIPAINLRGGLWLFDPVKVVAALEAQESPVRSLSSIVENSARGHHVRQVRR
jgi:predicted site-specific integrase-resolvase